MNFSRLTNMLRSFRLTSEKPLIPSGTLHLPSLPCRLAKTIQNGHSRFHLQLEHKFPARPPPCHSFWGRYSGLAFINASIVQGSGIGPTTYDISASDLHTLDPTNRMAKFADDFYILVGSSKRHTIISEHDYVEDWAKQTTTFDLMLEKLGK